MTNPRYRVTLDSTVYGHESTKWDKWDTIGEAYGAVESIIQNCPLDGIRRTVRIVYRGKVLYRTVLNPAIDERNHN
jgi:hypothetical protein